jgi:hypothetical protein
MAKDTVFFAWGAIEDDVRDPLFVQIEQQFGALFTALISRSPFPRPF